MTTLAVLRQVMRDFLESKGLRAVTAWPGEEEQKQTAPLVVVRVRGVEVEPGGFHRYLGETYDAAAQGWGECYGHAFGASFGLALYSPRETGEEGCRDLMDQVAEAFQQGGPAGLPVEKWTMGEIAWDRNSGMFRGEITAQVHGMLTEKTDGAGVFLEFEVKGGMKLW